jgi:DNA-binding transcriptional regulator YhcF (GntR family)
MSIFVMSQVWKNGPENQGELLVLLALADYANDEGECFPSMASVGKKARMSERNARRVVRKLEQDGYLTVRENRGRKHTNLYVLAFSKLKSDKSSDIQTDAQKTGHSRQENRTSATVKPDTAMSAEPSITIKEPSGAHARVSAKGQTRGPLADETAAILAEFLGRDGAKRRAWKEAAE